MQCCGMPSRLNNRFEDYYEQLSNKKYTVNKKQELVFEFSKSIPGDSPITVEALSKA
jgi:sporulation-control protein spo0M